MFLGTHSPRLDDKGRLFLPARFRDELAGGVVLTKGQERCVFVWRSADFRRKAEALAEASLTEAASRAYNRMFFAGAYEEHPDKQGRVTVPANLRDYAGLDRDCVVVGANTHLEIWDAAAWQAYEAAQEPGYAAQDGGVPGMTGFEGRGLRPPAAPATWRTFPGARRRERAGDLTPRPVGRSRERHSSHAARQAHAQQGRGVETDGVEMDVIARTDAGAFDGRTAAQRDAAQLGSTELGTEVRDSLLLLGLCAAVTAILTAALTLAG